MDATTHPALESLSAFADGELDPGEGRTVQAHLDVCATCSARVSGFAQLSGRLSAGQPGFPEWTLVSSFADGEATVIERRLASAHLSSCADCRATLDAVRTADAAIGSLPPQAPSARTDARIAALVHRAPVGSGRTLRWVAPRFAIAAISAVLVLLFSLAPTAPQAARLPDNGAIVAAAQHTVFNARTNTLYVLDAERGEVAAVDASSRIEQARIVVGGTPTALALNEPANTVLVLDGGQKRLTVIDGSNNTVVSAGRIEVSGTPTSMRVDPQGRIVVSSALAPAASASGSVDLARTGQVTVLNSASKQVESVKAVDVAPQSVVFDPAGRRALLLSKDATTVAEAATYRGIDRLPGGVAATFDATGGRIAVLSARAGAAELLVYAADAGGTSVTLAGTPIAVIALPDGGFAALLRTGSDGHIAVIGADGKIRSTIDVAAGTDLTFDAATARFAVIGGAGVAYAAAGPAAVAAQRPADTAPPSAPPAASAAPSASPSVNPLATRPSSGPTAAASAGGSLPPGAQLAWTGVYRLEVAGGHRPLRVAGSGARIWFIDQAMALGTIDTATAAVEVAAALPANWTASELLVSSRLVVAIDTQRGRIAVYDKTLERFDVFEFAFAQSARSFALAPDDRLWMAAPQGGTLIALDVRAKRAQAVDTGATGISAVAVDSGGRVSYADAVRKVLGTYDGVNHLLTETPLARLGRVTSLVSDAAGSRWAGTDAGELIVEYADGRTRITFAPGPIRSLTTDGPGVAWFTATTSGGVAFGPAVNVSAAQLGPSTTTGLAFDTRGSTWAADSTGSIFYIVKQVR